VSDAVLAPAGAERVLPQGIVGFNSPVTWDFPHEDPAMPAAAATLHPQLLRYPGGTIANYWDWRSGHLAMPSAENPWFYRKALMDAAPIARRAHPDGCSAEHFAQVAAQMGAEFILVPNLETATADDEAERVAEMAAQGIVPTRIEMGNEFWLGSMDEHVRARFPDWSTTLELTRQYLDALAPFLPAGAKVAVQSAGTGYHAVEFGEAARSVPTVAWDEAMRPEPWFHAVTAHWYPLPDSVVGPGTEASMPGNIDAVLPALVARAEEGHCRGLDRLAQQMPGKEIWLTEWGPLEIRLLQGLGPRFTAFWLHYVARSLIAMLTHPQVTVIQYHALLFDGGLTAVFGRDANGGYVPSGPADLLRWFFAAARPGARCTRMLVDGAERLPGGGAVDEGYHAVDAVLFEGGGTRTLLVHNAGREDVVVDVARLLPNPPTTAEVMSTPDLAEVLDGRTRPIEQIEAGARLRAPALSVCRVVAGESG
jgi:hypothetical protein